MGVKNMGLVRYLYIILRGVKPYGGFIRYLYIIHTYLYRLMRLQLLIPLQKPFIQIK
jgi:hypothetical protein